MQVFRIVKSRERTSDLSGFGAATYGGRWNSEGRYALYTSESASLALLENLVHFDMEDLPPRLYIMRLEISDELQMKQWQVADLPDNWREVGNLALRHLGDTAFRNADVGCIKVPSTVMPCDYNYLFNPLHPLYASSVRVVAVEEICCR